MDKNPRHMTVKEGIAVPEKVYLDTSVFFAFLTKEVRDAFRDSKPMDPNKPTIISSNIKPIKPKDIVRFIPVVHGKRGYMVQVYGKEHLINKLIEKSENGVSYCTSPLVFSEVVRKLRREYKLSAEDAFSLWWGVASAFRFERTKNNVIDLDKDLTMLARNYPLKKNVQDLLHIILAKQNDCLFVTKDKLDGNLDEIKKDYHNKIITLDDFIVCKNEK